MPPIRHVFVSPITDSGDPDLVGSDEWNADHEGGTSPEWWHPDNAPSSPHAANREFNEGTTIGALTRAAHGTPKGTWAETLDGLVWTQTVTSAADLDVFCVPITGLAIGDYATLAYQGPQWDWPGGGAAFGPFVGFSDGTTFGTNEAVGAQAIISSPFTHTINLWTNMNSRGGDGTVTQVNPPMYGVRWGVRVKYEAANTWGFYQRAPGGGWRTMQTNFAATLTPTHAVFGVSWVGATAFSSTVPVVARLECFRYND